MADRISHMSRATLPTRAPKTPMAPATVSFRAPEGLLVLEVPGAVWDAFTAPLAGTVLFNAVRFTGAGAFAEVKVLFRLAAAKTGPPPAPTADMLGAVNGTYLFALRGPGYVPLALVSGMLVPARLLFW